VADEPDIENSDALLRYLRKRGHIASDEIPRCTVLPGGVSNRTVLVERAVGEPWVLKQALSKLRVKEDWFSNPARSHREALGLQWLSRLAPAGAIPSLVFEDRECHLFAMKAVSAPHQNWKTRLLAGCVERGQVRQFGQLLGAIHGRARAFFAELSSLFDDRSFFESLRLEPYYQFTAARQPAAAEFLHQLVTDTLATRLTLVHGDYSPKNILIHQGQLVLLDHEVIHWGDPAFDLGFALAHLLSKAHHLPPQREAFLQAAASFWENYTGAAGELAGRRALEARAVRRTLGCLLARVDGRSPLEYLSETERARQRTIVLRLLLSAPPTLPELFEVFGQRLDSR